MTSARASAVLASLVFVLAATPCAAEWRRLDSPNFTVVGDVSARELRDLAVKFEGFRETLGRAISERATTSAVPTIIIVFPTDKAFTPFKPTYQGKPRAVAGFFAAGANINYILMQSGGAGVDRIVFHEYAHLIVSNVMSNAPIWLNEGLAEFYSTFKLMDGGRRAQLGLAIGEHLQRLRSAGRVPLPELLKVDARSPLYNEEARASVFYAESWALTHMILNGQPSRVAELSAYLRNVGDGVPEARAWEETFGTARTEQEFRQYLARDLYNTVVIDFPEKVAALSATPTLLSPADTAAFLGAFLVQHQQYGEAAAQLEQAFKADPASPGWRPLRWRSSTSAGNSTPARKSGWSVLENRRLAGGLQRRDGDGRSRGDWHRWFSKCGIDPGGATSARRRAARPRRVAERARSPCGSGLDGCRRANCSRRARPLRAHAR